MTLYLCGWLPKDNLLPWFGFINFYSYCFIWAKNSKEYWIVTNGASNLKRFSCYRAQCQGTCRTHYAQGYLPESSCRGYPELGAQVLCACVNLNTTLWPDGEHTPWAPTSPTSFPSYGCSHFLRGFEAPRSCRAVTRLTVTLSHACEGSQHESVGPMDPSPRAQWGLGTGSGAAGADRCYLRDTRAQEIPSAQSLCGEEEELCRDALLGTKGLGSREVSLRSGESLWVWPCGTSSSLGTCTWRRLWSPSLPSLPFHSLTWDVTNLSPPSAPSASP